MWCFKVVWLLKTIGSLHIEIECGIFQLWEMGSWEAEHQDPSKDCTNKKPTWPSLSLFLSLYLLLGIDDILGTQLFELLGRGAKPCLDPMRMAIGLSMHCWDIKIGGTGFGNLPDMAILLSGTADEEGVSLFFVLVLLWWSRRATNVQLQIWKCFSQIPEDRCVRHGISGFVLSFVSQHWCLLLFPFMCLLALASILCLPLHPLFHSWWPGIGTFIQLFPQVSLTMIVSGPDLFTYCCLLLLRMTLLHNYLIFYFGVYKFEWPRFSCCNRAPSKTCPCLQFSLTLCGSPILPSLGGSSEIWRLIWLGSEFIPGMRKKWLIQFVFPVDSLWILTEDWSLKNPLEGTCGRKSITGRVAFPLPWYLFNGITVIESVF